MPDTPPISTSRLANDAARAIRDAFVQFQSRFRAITRRAKKRFAGRDWLGMHRDSRKRLDVYAATADRLLTDLHAMLGDRGQSRIVWVGIKAVYSGLIDNRDDWELAETFFNSITRQIFSTVGVDNEIEFVHTDFASPPKPSRRTVYKTHHGPLTTELLRDLLGSFPDLGLNRTTLEADAQTVASEITDHLQAIGLSTKVERLEAVTSLFFRGERAYIVGRIVAGQEIVPLVIAFCHIEENVQADAVLLREGDISMLFSYTRSYFHVEVDRPHDMVAFVSSILPRKNTAEIYISLGYNKHGKTELYRAALRHLADSDDKYQIASGNRGMVMIVFTMPSYPVVFKVIRDHFDYPKECSRQEVIDKYQLVFNHDRAGRLIDAQQYKYLVLERQRFDEELLEELLRSASQSVTIDHDQVVIKRCYAERRVSPLNVYLQDASEDDAQDAVIDYGNAIKDLAMTNLFPGDLLLKNFGVTRKRRVVFYDYDEVCLLSDCNFRKFPNSGYYEDEMAAEPWYGVGPNDIFPEEFVNFLGLPPDRKSIFLEHHHDLVTAEYWQRLQQQLRDGALFHVPPYTDDKRLPNRRGQPERQMPCHVA